MGKILTVIIFILMISGSIGPAIYLLLIIYGSLGAEDIFLYTDWAWAFNIVLLIVGILAVKLMFNASRDISGFIIGLFK